jgi:hypothetical protein
MLIDINSFLEDEDPEEFGEKLLVHRINFWCMGWCIEITRFEGEDRVLGLLK